MTERNFLVSWAVDVDGLQEMPGADALPAVAASCAFHLMQRARAIHDPGAANVFEVTDKATGERWRVDLGEGTTAPLSGPAAIRAALDIAGALLDATEEDQTTGEAEGIYEPAPEVWEKLAQHRATLAAAREALNTL